MKNKADIKLTNDNEKTHLEEIKKNKPILLVKNDIALQIKRTLNLEPFFVCNKETVLSFMSSLGPALLNNSTITSLELAIASEEISTELGTKIYEDFIAVFTKNKTLTSLQLPKTYQSNCVTPIIRALRDALLSSNSVAIREIKLDGLDADNAPLLEAALNKNLITELSFDSKTGVVDEKILSQLLQIIATNNRLEILHLPSSTPFNSNPHIEKMPACLESNQNLRELHISIPIKSFDLFSDIFKRKPALTKIYSNYITEIIVDGYKEAASQLLNIFLKNPFLTAASIDSSGRSVLLDLFQRENQITILKKHLAQNQNAHRQHINYFIGMLSLLSTAEPSDNSIFYWHCFPVEIRSLIWQFWQIKFPMGKTSEQVDKCARFLNGSSSAIKQLVQSKSQRPLLLIERLTHQFKLQPREEEFTPASTSGLRIML